MRTDLFDFELPADRIALRPAVPRDAARLLVVRPGATPEWGDRIVRDLPDLLRPGDAIVVNDTKVIPARLCGRRLGRGTTEPVIEATLHQRLDGSRWRAFVKPAKRLSPGDVIRFGTEGNLCFLGQLDATVEAKGEGGELTLAFAFHGPILDQAVEERGAMPLPPYIAARRTPDERDRSDYQTMFAQPEGSVAAPTAGLHFTEALLAALTSRGINVHKVTLHVGAGTFQPVRTDDVTGHVMHSEWYEVPAATVAAVEAAHASGARVVSVGTTALRALESEAADGAMRAGSGETRLFVTPGYRFRVVDRLVTNFHLPRSTLLMLVSAFSGRENILAAYRHAVRERYRFFSYGDAMLLEPAQVLA